jgi:hypothetical protein
MHIKKIDILICWLYLFYILMPKKQEKTEHISDNESSDIENATAESETEDETNDNQDKKQKKLNAHELYSELTKHITKIAEVETSFVEKEKEFEKEYKEYKATHKKSMREIENLMKRFEKAFNAEVSKKKPRKTENAGKGGFNKQTDVPEVLRKYIGIDEDEKKSRPEVTKLLNAKFSEAGLMKTKKDDNGKEIKVIILDKATAKKLGRKENDEIRNKDIQTFIAQFYRESNTVNA